MSGECSLIVVGAVEIELAKMVRDEIATEDEFNAWRLATSSGVYPSLPATVADILHDRMEAQMRKSVDRMICPEGMTDLEHALLVAANCGASGRPVRDANAKRKQAAKETATAERNAPRMKALEAYRKSHPACTLPEAAEAMLEANVVPSLDAGKKWLRGQAKAGDWLRFEPGKRGRPQMSRGVSVRKPR